MSKNEIEKGFFGVTCQWFNSNHELQTEIFNTKDLKLYEL